MLEDKTALQALLKDTPLASAAVATIGIEGVPEKAFMIGIPRANPMQSWSVMRELVPETGRWPLLVTLWGGGKSWAEKVSFARAELFSRTPFAQDRRGSALNGDRPSDIIAASVDVDVEELLAARARQGEEFFDLEAYLEAELETTRERCGSVPQIDEPVNFMLAKKIYSRTDLERWLFTWEYHNCPHAREIAANDLDHLQWFDAHSPSLILLLMPSERHWEIPAYLHWFGATPFGSPMLVALLREWHLRYGAELVGHHGTMLELTTTRLPASPEEAFDLAWQQETVAECTTMTAGVPLRDHARALLHTQSWFLHQRP